MAVGAVEEKMGEMKESGINLPDISSVSKSGFGILEAIMQILSENEVRMSFRDFKMDGEVRFHLRPLKKD